MHLRDDELILALYQILLNFKNPRAVDNGELCEVKVQTVKNCTSNAILCILFGIV